MTTGERIFEARKKVGMTQEELAERLGVTRQAVSKWESDAAFPETDKIVELCKLFNLSADKLLLGVEGNAAEAKEKCFKELLEEKRQSEGWYKGGRCDGYTCTEYKTCKGRIEFDKLIKVQPTQEDTEKEKYARGWFFDNKDGNCHFEYVSKARIGKLPLVHINIGLGAYRAKGVIAIGNAATGIISIGLLSVGLLSLGLISLGLFAFGAFAFGLLMGAGAVATGLMAFGGVAIGIMCFGGVAIGYIGVGGCAVGQYAVGGYARGFVAVGVTGADGTNTFLMPTEFKKLCDFLSENVGGFIGSFVKSVASSLN